MMTVRSNDTSFQLISDFFHLRLGASARGDQQHTATASRCFVLADLISPPFPQAHLSVWGSKTTSGEKYSCGFDVTG